MQAQVELETEELDRLREEKKASSDEGVHDGGGGLLSRWQTAVDGLRLG